MKWKGGKETFQGEETVCFHKNQVIRQDRQEVLITKAQKMGPNAIKYAFLCLRILIVSLRVPVLFSVFLY